MNPSRENWKKRTRQGHDKKKATRQNESKKKKAERDSRRGRRRKIVGKN